MQKIKQKSSKIIILILLVSILIFLNRNVLIYRPLLDILPLKTTKAIIINEKENSRRSHLTGMFNYYYKFQVGDKIYKNPSYGEKYQVGQIVTIEYSQTFPFMNRIKPD